MVKDHGGDLPKGGDRHGLAAFWSTWVAQFKRIAQFLKAHRTYLSALLGLLACVVGLKHPTSPN